MVDQNSVLVVCEDCGYEVEFHQNHTPDYCIDCHERNITYKNVSEQKKGLNNFLYGIVSEVT